MNPEAPLKWLVFGAGAIGAYIGGSLAILARQRVVFVERPDVAEYIRAHGLHLNLLGQEHHLAQPQVVGSLPEALSLGPFDLAIFALKSYDTQAALQNMIPHRQALPTFLCLQNGVENESALESTLGAGQVIAGTVTSSIARRAAGDIILERSRGVGIAAGHPLSQAAVTSLRQAEINAQLFPAATDMKWSKMLTNLLANASAAILDLTPAQVFAHPGLYRLEIAQLRETLTVMQAHNIQTVNLPGAPVRWMEKAIQVLPLIFSRPLLQRAVGGGRGAKMPSFHIDLHSGRGMSEVDYLNGAVVRFGERKQVATPVNRLLNQTLLALTRQEIPANTFTHQPEKLLELWKTSPIEIYSARSKKS